MPSSCLSVVDDDEISVERKAGAAGLESTLAMLWALEKGLLVNEIQGGTREHKDEPPCQRNY
jgi:hypothetical protein